MSTYDIRPFTWRDVAGYAVAIAAGMLTSPGRHTRGEGNRPIQTGSELAGAAVDLTIEILVAAKDRCNK